jgi:hypothetical protein
MTGRWRKTERELSISLNARVARIHIIDVGGEE